MTLSRLLGTVEDGAVVMEESADFPPSSPSPVAIEADELPILAVDLAAEPEHFLVGFCEDVAELALFVPCDAPPPIDDHRALRLLLPTGVVESIAEVAFHRAKHDAGPAGYALRFLDLDDDDRRALSELIRATTAPRRPSIAPPSARGPASSPRRSHPRIQVALDVQVERPLEADVTFDSEHNFYTGFSENIGDGGLFLQSWATHRVGDRVHLRVTLPDDDEPLDLRGEVRWLRAYDRTSDTAPGVGIAFVDLDARAKSRIEAFVQQRKPLFYD